MSLLARRSPSGRVVVVSLLGDHDIATSHEVRRALIDAQGARLVVADLTGCTFVDSTVLGVLVSASKRIAKAGGRLVALNATGVVRTALTITHVGELLQSTDDLSWDPEADALLQREEQRPSPLVQ